MDEPQEDKEAKKAHGHRLQSELFALEGDRSREERRRADFEMEIKRIDSAIDHLEAERQSKKVAFAAAERKLSTLDEDISHLKKQMNAL